MHMEMVAVIWSLGDDFDGAVEMPDDGPMMEPLLEMVNWSPDDVWMVMVEPLGPVDAMMM